jgi:O-antigen/teichoic acid export membrane protein
LNPIKKLAGQTVIYGLSSVVPKFLNYFLVPLYTYYFQPAEYGIIGDLYSIAVIVNIIVTYGMETAFLRFTKGESKTSIVYTTSLISIIFSSLLFLFLVSINLKSIANSLDYADKQQYILWLALIICFDAICAIPFVKLRQENKAFKFAAIKISSVVLNLILNVIFLVIFPYLALKGYISSINLFYNHKIGVGYVFIANIISSCVTLIFLIKDFSIKIKFDFLLWKRMIKYAAPLLVAGLAGSINDVIDRQFIKYLSPQSLDSMSQLGIYFANTKIAVVLTVFIQTFRFAAEPFFFNYEREKDSKEVFAKVMIIFIGISFSMYLFTYGNLSLFKYLIGSNYWEGLKIVPFVLMANVLTGVYINLSIWYKLTDKNYYGIIIIAFGALITILLNFIFVPKYGYIASAYIRLICYVFMVYICYLLGNRFYKIPYNLKRLTYYSVIVVLFSAIIYLMQHFSYIIQLIFNNLILIVFIIIFLNKEDLIVVLKTSKIFKL